MRRGILAVALAVALLASCGGSGIELKNGMSAPITDVVLTSGEQEATWETIENGETVKSSIGLQPRSTITLSFRCSGRERTETVNMPEDREEAPEAVWIGIYGDRLSLEYAY
jgi:hypothetical protein